MRPRYVALWVPNWEFSSLVASVPPAAPAVVAHGRRIQKVTPSASRLGVRPGMPLVMAQHLSSNLLVLPQDEARDASAFEAVLEVFDQFAAGVVAVAPGLAFAPARSAAKWSGGEDRLAESLVEAVTIQTGVECFVGIADTLSGALLAARSGTVVPSEETQRFMDSQALGDLIADLPTVSRLGLAEDLRVMRNLGIDCVGDLRRLGEGPILTRFGRSGEVLLQLLRGSSPLLAGQSRNSPAVEVSFELDPPVALAEYAAVAIRKVSAALADRLTQRGLFSSTVRITLERVNREKSERTWTLLEATSSSQVGKRVTWQLRAFAGSATVSDVQNSSEDSGGALQWIHIAALHPVAAPETEPLWGGQQGLRRASAAVEEVQVLLGEDSAVVPTLHGGFDPRTRVSFVPWGAALEDAPGLTGQWEGRVAQTPAVLFSKPRSALLMGNLDDGTVGAIRVNERGALNGTPTHLILKDEHRELPAGDYPVKAVKGIWLIRGRWWKESGWLHRPRCYLRLTRDAGGDLLVAQRSRSWWVEGIYPRQLTAPSVGSIAPGNKQV